MACRRQMSSTSPPASCSFSTPITCSSLNRLCFVGLPPRRSKGGRFQLAMARIPGRRSAGRYSLRWSGRVSMHELVRKMWGHLVARRPVARYKMRTTRSPSRRNQRPREISCSACFGAIPSSVRPRGAPAAGLTDPERDRDRGLSSGGARGVRCSPRAGRASSGPFRAPRRGRRSSSTASLRRPSRRRRWQAA